MSGLDDSPEAHVDNPGYASRNYVGNEFWKTVVSVQSKFHFDMNGIVILNMYPDFSTIFPLFCCDIGRVFNKSKAKASGTIILLSIFS